MSAALPIQPTRISARLDATEVTEPFTAWSVVNRDEAHIEVRGELDATGVPALERAFALAESGEVECFVLDLGRLTFLDVSGLRAIVAAHRRLDQQQRPLLLRRGTSAVQRLFELTDTESSLYFLA